MIFSFCNSARDVSNVMKRNSPLFCSRMQAAHLNLPKSMAKMVLLDATVVIVFILWRGPDCRGKMIQQDRMPGRFGIHASVIQLLAWLITGIVLDRGITQGAFALASLLFWICSAALLWWRDGYSARADRFFLRWGLLAFVLVGTPAFRLVLERWEWLLAFLYPVLAALIVLPLMYLMTRIIGIRSPFDGPPPTSEK